MRPDRTAAAGLERQKPARVPTPEPTTRPNRAHASPLPRVRKPPRRRGLPPSLSSRCHRPRRSPSPPGEEEPREDSLTVCRRRTLTATPRRRIRGMDEREKAPPCGPTQSAKRKKGGKGEPVNAWAACGPTRPDPSRPCFLKPSLSRPNEPRDQASLSRPLIRSRCPSRPASRRSSRPNNVSQTKWAMSQPNLPLSPVN